MPLTGIDALVFDLYGTLLDVDRLDEQRRAVLPQAEGLVALWRATQLRYTFIRTLMGDYVDFWAITAAALDHAAACLGVPLAPSERQRLLDAWLDLRPFPEVPAALAALAGRPLAILSNGSPAMLDAALERSGLKPAFDLVLSADTVRRFKPHPAVYALAPAWLRLPAERILFCSSNGFDVAGAGRFGLRVCHVARDRAPLDRLGVEPDVTIASLADLPGLLAPRA
ncbi:MAG: haloacid dehalogenase type II [Sphaerobacter sp.]|nr:haloacid dehalogenase type II [Sphaerobacter sp.]